jgi:hypothetical protein
MNGKADDGAHRRTASAYGQSQQPQHQRLRGRLIAIVITAVVCIAVFSSTNAVSTAASKHLPSGPKLPKLSYIHNPFAQAVHKPPEQSNSSAGDSKWHADWKWLNPFSSTITLDDTRSVLPPLPLRPHIYTYYDSSVDKDPVVKKAEYELLQVWRRAWWAQGFKPVILGRAEAMKNPHYQTLQQKELYKALENELMRWLAWGHMGDGILSNWLVLPMAPRNDHDLTYLRRGQYPALTRYEGLGNGIFAGTSNDINAAVKAVLNAPKLEDKKTIFEAVDHHVFEVEPNPPGIAFYESSTISHNYKAVADKLSEHQAEGLTSLAQLINSHLHGTFLAANCRDGFNILTPKPKETMLLSAPANALAYALNECPESPLPRSCPPNNPKCTPCDKRQIKYRPSIHNISQEFTIGTIPHPYTLALLVQGKSPEELTVAYVRRRSDRDPWLEKATEQVLTEGVSAYARIVSFKDWIVTDAGQTRGIWHSAERDWKWHELEWRFGFGLHGRNGTIDIPEPTEQRYPDGLDPMIKAMSKRPTRKEVVVQHELFKSAKQELAKTRFHRGPDMRRVVEAWSLADTEAWRFVRAFEARMKMVREAWLDDERQYIGGDLAGDRDD